MILPPISEIDHHHKVTDIKMSPTSLYPFNLQRFWQKNEKKNRKIRCSKILKNQDSRTDLK